MNQKTLLDLNADLQQINALIDEVEEEITPELRQAFEDLFQQKEEIEEHYLTKLDNIAALIQERKYSIEIRKKEAQRLLKLAKTDENTVNWLSSYLLEHLMEKKIKKFRTKRFNLSVVANGGKPPLIVDDVSITELPEKYQKVKVEVDKVAVREALSQGESLNFARFGKKGSHLKIR